MKKNIQMFSSRLL